VSTRAHESGSNGAATPAFELTVVTLEKFVETDEPGARPLLGDADHALIPEGGDAMLYGNGGTGKTTLSIDLAFHLAAGDDWLRIPVPQSVRVLIIENEGPRPFLRKKLRCKLDAWQGSQLEERLSVFERPWGEFSFSTREWRIGLAETIRQRQIDLIIAGPLTRIGMDEKGTLQEVAAFMTLVKHVRELCGRLLTVVLIHHENKGGSVSGAWEGAGDTLLHVQAAGNGHTLVLVQKARWDSARTQTTLKLAWADGESFELEGDRDYGAEIEALLIECPALTAKQIAAPRKDGGIGAKIETVKATLDATPETFESRTGDAAKALGRHPNAIVWNVRGLSPSPETVETDGQKSDSAGIRGGTSDSDSPLRESDVWSPYSYDPDIPPGSVSNPRDTPEPDPTPSAPGQSWDGALGAPRCSCPDPKLTKDRVCLRCGGLHVEDDSRSRSRKGLG
jgi:hypothetical protein